MTRTKNARIAGSTLLVYIAAGVFYGATGLLMAWHLMRPQLQSASRTGMWTIVGTAWPFCLGSLFAMLTARVDVFLIEVLGTSAMVGQYNAAFRFVDLGMAVVITVLTPLLTVLTRLAFADRASLGRAFDAMMCFVATGATAIAVLAPTLTAVVLKLVYGPQFEIAAPTLNVLAWKFQVAFINLLMFATLMTVASIRFTWWTSALALCANVIANIVLIPQLGILGAGVASLASELVQTGVDLVFVIAALGRVLTAGWWKKLAFVSLCASAVVHAPIGLDRIWLLAPAALVFFGLLYIMKAIPSNPLRVVQAEVSASTQPIAAP